MKRTTVEWMCDECCSDEQTPKSITFRGPLFGKNVRLDFCNGKCQKKWAMDHRDEGN